MWPEGTGSFCLYQKLAIGCTEWLTSDFWLPVSFFRYLLFFQQWWNYQVTDWMNDTLFLNSFFLNYPMSYCHKSDYMAEQRTKLLQQCLMHWPEHVSNRVQRWAKRGTVGKDSIFSLIAHEHSRIISWTFAQNPFTKWLPRWLPVPKHLFIIWQAVETLWQSTGLLQVSFLFSKNLLLVRSHPTPERLWVDREFLWS